MRVDPQKDIVLDVSSTSTEESEEDEPEVVRIEKPVRGIVISALKVIIHNPLAHI